MRRALGGGREQGGSAGGGEALLPFGPLSGKPETQRCWGRNPRAKLNSFPPPPTPPTMTSQGTGHLGEKEFCIGSKWHFPSRGRGQPRSDGGTWPTGNNTQSRPHTVQNGPHVDERAARGKQHKAAGRNQRGSSTVGRRPQVGRQTQKPQENTRYMRIHKV